MVNFLYDFLRVLKGENQEAVKRFFSLWMDINIDHFITAYSRSTDYGCSIATTFGDNIPESEMINEFREREAALNVYLTQSDLSELKELLQAIALQFYKSK